MGKIWGFTVMFLTMMLFLEFMGIPTGAGNTLQAFGITTEDSNLVSADFEQSELWNKIFIGNGILVAIGLGTVVVGLFTRTYDTSLVIIPLILTLASWMIVAFASIMTIVSGETQWLIKIISLIFIGLGAAFIGACVDYFRSGQ